MINLDDFEIFNARQKSLKELSKDDSDPNNVTFMTCCELSSVDFDAVKDNYQRKLGLSGDRASSVDAAFQIFDSIIFLEFKNGNMKNEKSKVKQKLRDSLLIFSDLTGMTITDTRQNAEFILVYNESKNALSKQEPERVQESESRLMIGKHVSQKAGEELIRFDLERFKSLYFRGVHTYTEKEFDIYLLNNHLE